MEQVNELKEGEIYKAISTQVKDLTCIFKAKANRGHYFYLDVETESFYKDEYDYQEWLTQDHAVYKAAYEETKWLEACEKAGKFIPKEEVILELPEKWCIKTTPETREIVFKFIQSKGYPLKMYDDFYVHYPFPILYASCFTNIQEGYKEITFQQFKEHILKEKAVEKEFKVGDIVKCYSEPKNINTPEKGAGFGFSPNLVFEIKRIDKTKEGYKIAFPKNGHGIYFGNFEKVKELPKIDLTNTKIRVNTPELSKKVQEIAFSLGLGWVKGGKIVRNIKYPFLYFSKSDISCGEDEKFFIEDKYKEIFLSDLGIFDYPLTKEQCPVKSTNNQEITLKEIVKPKVNVDLTIQKLPEIRVDINITAKQIKPIKLETFSLNI